MIPHIMGIGGECGIDGPQGSEYLIEEWQYPRVGIVIASEGHTAFMPDPFKARRGVGASHE